MNMERAAVICDDRFALHTKAAGEATIKSEFVVAAARTTAAREARDCAASIRAFLEINA